MTFSSAQVMRSVQSSIIYSKSMVVPLEAQVPQIYEDKDEIPDRLTAPVLLDMQI